MKKKAQQDYRFTAYEIRCSGEDQGAYDDTREEKQPYETDFALFSTEQSIISD